MVVFVVFATTFVDLPGNTKLIRELQNTGHTFAFGILAFVLLKVLRGFDSFENLNGKYQYIFIFVICLFAGILIELFQLYVHRDADVFDVARDVAGIIAFLGANTLADKNLITYKKTTGKKLKIIGVTVSVVVLILALLPLARLTIIYIQRYQSFPVLADFKSGWINEFLTPNHSDLKIVNAPDDWMGKTREMVARIILYPAQYPGLEFYEPQPDWTGYTNLNFKIFSRHSVPISLILRIHDIKHNNQYTDRFNRTISIKPGETTVRIPLTEIKSAPERREMEMSQIDGLIVFVAQLDKTVKFYLGNIWLD
jgi:VanZ family protein